MAKQRGHNEGTISQRKDGRWEARVSVGYKDGKHVSKCIYGKTREEVASKMVKALGDLQTGLSLPDEKVTMQNFLETWLENTAKGRLRPSTFKRYGDLIRLHVVPHIGQIPVGKLTPQRLQRLWADLQGRGLSPATVIQIRAILRTALNQAVKYSLTPKNAASLSEPPKKKPFKPTFLDPDQAEKLLQASKGHALEALVTLALTTGMRIGEILGLTWGDIDFDKRCLKISRTQQRVGRELITSEPKTERSARTIPLTEMACNALAYHKEMQIALLRTAIGEGRVMSGRVFTNEKGKPVENGTVLRQFKRLADQAGLPPMRLHDLRHSCATLLLFKGVHFRVVMEILGHSTIAMTMNVYSHVVPRIAREAADAMDTLFTGPKESNSAS